MTELCVTCGRPATIGLVSLLEGTKWVCDDHFQEFMPKVTEPVEVPE